MWVFGGFLRVIILFATLSFHKMHYFLYLWYLDTCDARAFLDGHVLSQNWHIMGTGAICFASTCLHIFALSFEMWPQSEQWNSDLLTVIILDFISPSRSPDPSAKYPKIKDDNFIYWKLPSFLWFLVLWIFRAFLVGQNLSQSWQMYPLVCRCFASTCSDSLVLNLVCHPQAWHCQTPPHLNICELTASLKALSLSKYISLLHITFSIKLQTMLFYIGKI